MGYENSTGLWFQRAVLELKMRDTLTVRMWGKLEWKRNIARNEVRGLGSSIVTSASEIPGACDFRQAGAVHDLGEHKEQGLK